MGRFTGGRPGQAAAGSTGRSPAGGIRPGRWAFAASTASATAPAKPSFPWLRTRSRPRCSRLLMADPPAAWARRGPPSTSCPCGASRRLRHPGRPQPVRGAVRTAVEAHHRQVGEPARASPPMGTATSTSLPSHITERRGRNPCRSSGTWTGTPGSTGTPALPFDIQRVCGLDIGCTFPRCGIVPPFRIRRPVRSARCLTWPMKPRILSDGPGIPNLPSISARPASALSASFRASRSGASTSPGRGLASRDVATRR